jgi:hypothetical protein
MIEFSNVHRRNFLRIVLSVGTLVSTGQLKHHLVTTASPSTDDLLTLKLTDFYSDKESARIVGLEYLRTVPTERDAGELAKLICSPLDHDQILRASTVEIKALLRHQQREDFENERIVKVNGWILSQTEARLCALAALA